MGVIASRLAFEEDVSFEGLEESADLTAALSRRFGCHTGVAVHPDRFSRILSSRAFTNGSDLELVQGLYERTFEVLKHTKVQELNHATWSEQIVEQYAEALNDFIELKKFVLWHCKIGGDMGLQRLMPALSGKPCIQIVLVGLGMTDTGLSHVCEHLPRDVERLNVMINMITDAGAEMLAQIVPTSAKKLKFLSIKDNQVTNIGVATLKESLPSSVALQ